MKTVFTVLTAAFVLSAAAVHAGGVVEPAMPEAVVIAETSNSNDGILVPIMALIMFGFALAD